jgi:hypothetical protein
VLKPVNVDVDFLQMQHISILFRIVLFLKQKFSIRKVLNTIPILVYIVEYRTI